MPSYKSDLGGSLQNLAQLLMDKGETREARALLEQAVVYQRAALAINPKHPTYQRFLANHLTILSQLGTVILSAQRYPEGEAVLRRVLELWDELGPALSAADARVQVALAESNLGGALMDQGRREEAEASIRSTIKIQESLVAEHPSVLVHRQRLRIAATNLGRLLHEHFKDQGGLPEAESAYGQALKLAKELVAEVPEKVQYRTELADTSDRLGRLLRYAGRIGEAERAGREAVEIMRSLAALDPGDFKIRLWAGGTKTTLRKRSESRESRLTHPALGTGHRPPAGRPESEAARPHFPRVPQDTPGKPRRSLPCARRPGRCRAGEERIGRARAQVAREHHQARGLGGTGSACNEARAPT